MNDLSELIDEPLMELTPRIAILSKILFDLDSERELIYFASISRIIYFCERFGLEKEFETGLDKTIDLISELKELNIIEVDPTNPYKYLLVMDSRKYADDFFKKSRNVKYKNIADSLMAFLSGYYSSYSLCLLCSVDHLCRSSENLDLQTVEGKLKHYHNGVHQFKNVQHILIALDKVSQLKAEGCHD